MFTTEDIITANKGGITHVYALWNSMKHIFNREEDNKKEIPEDIEELILYGETDHKIPIEYLFPEYTVNYKRKTGLRFIPGIVVGDHKYLEEIRRRISWMNFDLMTHVPDTSRTFSYSDKEKIKRSKDL